MATTFKDRANKYSAKRKSSLRRQQEPTRFNFGLEEMNGFCSYILSENISIHHNSLKSLRDLLCNYIDESIFSNDQECIIRYRLAQQLLDSKLDKGIDNRAFLVRDVQGIIGNRFNGLDMNQFRELSNEEVEWIERLIADCCSKAYINNHIFEIYDATSNYITSINNPLVTNDNINNISTAVENYHQAMRMYAYTDNLDNTLDMNNCDGVVSDIYKDQSRPVYRLKTGMQGLNGILGGGVENGRVYCFFGLPGEGKTVTLMNLAYQIKMFNKDYVCKDKTKIPCVVFLSMENTINQIMNMIFNIGCTPRPMTDFPQAQVQQMLKSLLGVSEDNPINIVFRYKPINSVNTSYLYELYDELEDSGYEPICFIMDYIKRIRPVDYMKDMRIDLGNVINDFKNFAAAKDVPVLTASQFNREGVRMVDESRNSSRHDIVNKVGRAMIGESGLIDENLDFSIFIAKEWIDDNVWMGFKLAKHRDRIFTNVTTFYQPFHEDNAIKYQTDVGLAKPLYKETLVKSELEIREAFGETIKMNARKDIMPIQELLEKESRDLTPEEIEEKILGGKVYTNKPKEEAACKPLPIGFHRVVWNNNIGMQRIVFTA